jgi:hypothetical protein
LRGAGFSPRAEPGLSAEEVEVLRCDDIPEYYGLGIDVFVAGGRAMLTEDEPAPRRRAQSIA